MMKIGLLILLGKRDCYSKKGKCILFGVSDEKVIHYVRNIGIWFDSGNLQTNNWPPNTFGMNLADNPIFPFFVRNWLNVHISFCVVEKNLI